jgi:hypothetical protein
VSLAGSRPGVNRSNPDWEEGVMRPRRGVGTAPRARRGARRRGPAAIAAAAAVGLALTSLAVAAPAPAGSAAEPASVEAPAAGSILGVGPDRILGVGPGSSADDQGRPLVGSRRKAREPTAHGRHHAPAVHHLDRACRASGRTRRRGGHRVGGRFGEEAWRETDRASAVGRSVLALLRRDGRTRPRAPSARSPGGSYGGTQADHRSHA